MAISLKHSFTSAVADEVDTSLVRPSNWNAEHTLTLATSRLLGRTTAGTGAAEEISVGTGLNLSSGSLSVSSTTPQVNSINTFTVAQVIETTDNSNPALRITQLGTADALRVEDETSPDATPFVITAAGHAIAGYGSTLTIETVVPQFQSHTNTLDEGGFGGVDWGNTATGQVNWFGKSRGGSYGTQAIVQSGDTIGDFRFYGSDGVGLIPAAKIEVDVDGTPGVNDMPGRISFFTTADGASTVTERFRIGNAGQWGIGGATYGTSGQAFVSGGASAAPSWGTLGIAGGGTGQTTASAAANALDGYLSITSAGGTTTLTNTSPRNIIVTGSTTQTIQLPDVTTLQLGWSYIINNTNTSTGNITVQSSGGNAFGTTINIGQIARLSCVAVTGTTTASWAFSFIGSSARTGTGGLVYATSPTLNTPIVATLRGGSAASATLTLQSTSGAGTTDAIIMQTGSQSERFRIDTSGALGIGGANYGTATQYMKSGGTSAAPSWATISNTDISGLGTMSTQAASNVSITGGSITGITDLAVADGGTGVSSFTAYAVLAGGTTSTGAVQTVSGLGTSGQVLTSNGAGALPTWKSNWVQVGVYTASNSTSLDVTDLSAYRAIRITMSSILPATDSVNLLLRLSSDNGANFIATNYDLTIMTSTNSATIVQSTAGTSFPFTGNVGNVSTDGAVGGNVMLTNFNTAVYTAFISHVAVGNPGSATVFTPGGGIHRSATAMNAVRLIFSSGNITSGNIIVEGLV